MDGLKKSIVSEVRKRERCICNYFLWEWCVAEWGRSSASEGDRTSLQRQSAKVSAMEEELEGAAAEDLRARWREDNQLPSFVRLHQEDKEKVNFLVGALERLVQLRCIR